MKRIELICGSIEAFLEDPSKLRQGRVNPNFEWMRRVSLEESQICLEHMHLWAKSDKMSSGGGSLGEWVFNKKPRNVFDLVMAKTRGAAQLKWRTPTEFPCCP